MSGLVIVGAGLAAAKTIEALREAGDDRRVTLIGQEGALPYERPGLSKSVLQGKKEPADMQVHDADWYAGVDLHLDDPATGLDPAARQVTLASGVVVDYDDLVLATGAEPRVPAIPGADLPGVHTLRRAEDSLALRAAFGPGQRLVVIGAGWIGLEAAAAARQAGAEVTVLEAADVPLRAAMGAGLGEHFAELHRRNGVDLRTGVSVTAIEGSERATGVRLGDEVLPADVVLIGIGAAPNTSLAEAAGLPVDNGVVVDDRLRAADHVYAVGDLANAAHPTLGRLRVEHWDNAIRTGQLAGRILAGDAEAHYDWLPYFYTDQFDLGMEYIGHGSADDDVVIRGDRDSGEFLAFWQRDGVVTAVMAVNIWDVIDDLRAVVGRTVAPATLADPGASLTD